MKPDWLTSPAAIDALHDMRAIADRTEADDEPRFEPVSRWLSYAACVFAIAAFAVPYLRGFFQ